MKSVISHVGIHCADLDASALFYDAVLATLGSRRVVELGFGIGYGENMPDFWIYEYPEDWPRTMPNRQVHLAFGATDAAGVRAFHNAAVNTGAQSIHAPRLWPEYHELYYGAFVLDPDGNNVEAVCHTGNS